jgi:diamine N-acetyltransferase
MGAERAPVRVELRPLDRGNLAAMLALKLRAGQERFVASPAKSIGASYVREAGDNYRYTPMVICAGPRVVGYITVVCDAATDDDYWIDDIMIDADHQGCGYGRAAAIEAVRGILAAQPRCRAIKLTCFRTNTVAQGLYRSIGFRETGTLHPVNHEPKWELSGAALDAYRG